MKISQESVFKVNSRDRITSYFNSRYPYSASTLELYINIFDINGKPIPNIENSIRIEYYKDGIKSPDVIIPSPIVSETGDTEFMGILAVKSPGLYRFELYVNDERICIGEPIANVIDQVTEPISTKITGIFPRQAPGIVPFNRAINGIDVDVVEGCNVGYYSNECSPSIDPASINGIMSELAEIMRATGLPYDCNRTDNVINAIYRIFNSGDDRRYFISQTTETVDGIYFPPIVYPNPRISFPELREKLIAEDNSAEFNTMLEQCKLIDHTFTLSNDDKLYFDLQGSVYLSDVYDEYNRHIDFTDRSIAVVAVDGKFVLYDENVTDPALYSRNNLGTFNNTIEQVHLKTEPIELPKGSHNVKVYIMQFHKPLFPTDIKYRENYTRLRVDSNNPRVQFRVLRSI